jgi:outer membrane protein
VRAEASPQPRYFFRRPHRRRRGPGLNGAHEPVRGFIVSTPTPLEVFVKKTFIAVSLFVLIGVVASAQTLKIGYVDSQKIFEGLPEAKEAQKQLDAKLQVWQDSLEQMSKGFQDQYDAYQKQQGMMAEPAKQKKQEELMRMQNEIQDFRQKKFGQQGEAAILRAKVLQPLQERVLQAIGEVAKEEKLNFVFDKIQDASILLYADAKFEYTYKVLDKMKRGSK